MLFRVALAIKLLKIWRLVANYYLQIVDPLSVWFDISQGRLGAPIELVFDSPYDKLLQLVNWNRPIR